MEVTCARNIIVGIWDYLLPHEGFKVEHIQVGDHSAFGDQASTLKNLGMSSYDDEYVKHSQRDTSCSRPPSSKRPWNTYVSYMQRFT